jgi:hypothetical protein
VQLSLADTCRTYFANQNQIPRSRVTVT